MSDELDRVLNGQDEPRTDREWKLLFAYRLRELERRVNGIFRAVVVIACGIIIGVAVYVLTVVVAASGGAGP